jgi:uncharacterized membrane protein YccC
MPLLFAFGDQIVGRPQYTLFAAFGAFALMGFNEFGGPMSNRVRSQLVLAVCGSGAIVAGTLASRNPWESAAVMAVGSFVVLFAGVVSSQIARSSTSVILPLIVAAALPANASALPDRLEGYATAAAVSFVALRFLWPVPAVDPLRAPSITALRLLADLLRRSAVVGTNDDLGEADASRQAAVAALSRAFVSTPLRPTGLSTQTRLNVRLVEELAWLDRAISRWAAELGEEAVGVAAADVLDACANVLESRSGQRQLEVAIDRIRAELARSERDAIKDAEAGERDSVAPQELFNHLVSSFRAQELAFAVRAIAATVEATLAAEGRGWWSTLLGHQPAVSAPLMTARARAAAHLDPSSVWLRNSLRAAIALGLATLIAGEIHVQHSFWVVFGALSVLRSNAVSTGQLVSRAVAGTTVGFAIGAALISIVGTNTGPLWAVLPLSVLVGGLAPIVFSFAVGQAAFTVTILVLFNIIAPQGWRLGVVRVEDVVLGCAVSLGVALLFWPRGAGAQLRAAIGDAYALAGQYLAEAVDFASACCSFTGAPPVPPSHLADLAADATRRLDDAFRTYLAERGAKPAPLVEITNLLIGSAALRLTAEAVLELWRGSDPPVPGTATEVRVELVAKTNRVRSWFDELARSLTSGAEIHEPLDVDVDARQRFIAALGDDLASRDGRAATAVRLVWSELHVLAAIQLQRNIVDSARIVVNTQQPALSPQMWLRARTAG